MPAEFSYDDEAGIRYIVDLILLRKEWIIELWQMKAKKRISVD